MTIFAIEKALLFSIIIFVICFIYKNNYLCIGKMTVTVKSFTIVKNKKSY